MTIFIAMNILSSLLFAEPSIMPGTCNDLLPDLGEHIMFMEQVAHLWISKDPAQARKVYDVLAIRRLYQETTKNYVNPIDGQIKNYLCDCYFKNKKQLYRADSLVIRKYSQKNINKLISSATDEYLKLRMKLYDDQKEEKMSLAWRQRILKMRAAEIRTMQKKLNADFNKKLKARRYAKKEAVKVTVPASVPVSTPTPVVKKVEAAAPSTQTKPEQKTETKVN
jgi:hypothetical protein